MNGSIGLLENAIVKKEQIRCRQKPAQKTRQPAEQTDAYQMDNGRAAQNQHARLKKWRHNNRFVERKDTDAQRNAHMAVAHLRRA